MTALDDEKVTLELDRYEYGVVFHSLNEKRNAMLRENRATDAVDDVLLTGKPGKERKERMEMP